MRVLILTITAGQGHHAAAQSITDALLEKNAEVKTIDVYKTINKLLYNSVNNIYLFSTKYTPSVYRTIYSMLESKERKSALQNLGNLLIAHKFDSFIEEFHPDFIICTHIFAAQVVNELKRKKRLTNVPTVGIVTDYTLHPFWEDVSYIEYIDMASPLLIHSAIKRGVPRERLCSHGIPVQLKFSEHLPQAEARQKLGLDPDKKTVLIMAGSMGYGNMSAIITDIQRVYQDLQILAVCGNNKRQYKKLINMNLGDLVHPYGFIDNVDLMMDAADCIITKPGGLTVSEAMAKRLPLILINPIPGQEERNLDFLLNNGIALSVTKSFPVDEALNFLFESPGRLDAIRDRLPHVVTPNASRNLATFVTEEIKKQKDTIAYK